jgi:hypothetical protein
MTGNKMTGLLAATAIALGMITMGCTEGQSASEAGGRNGGFIVEIEGVSGVLTLDEDGFIQQPELWDESNATLESNALTADDNTMPDPLDVLGDVVIDVETTTIPAKVENLLLDSKTLVVIGYVHYETMQYVFDSGLVLDPDQITDIDESDVMIPDACDEEECTEDGDGHYPHSGERVLPERALPKRALPKRTFDVNVQTENLEELGMYVEPQGEHLVKCYLYCEPVPHPECWEVCIPERG